MDVSIYKKELVELLKDGGCMAGNSKAIPILDNAKFTFKNGQVVVESCDTECQVAKRGHYIYCSEEMEFLVNPNDFLKAINTLKDDNINFTVNDKVLIVKHKKGKMELPVFDASEFIKPKQLECTNTFAIKSEKLFDWINTAKVFASSDGLRPILMGMYLYIDAQNIGICATDINKLFTDSYEHELQIKDPISATIPSKCFNAIQSVINGTDEVEVRLSQRDITFKTTNSRLTCTQNEGNYPNFRAVIPVSNNIIIDVDKSEIKESIDRSNIFSNKSTSLLELDVRDNQINLSAVDIDFQKASTEEVRCKNTNGKIKIGVNGEMLSKCLNCLKGEDVRFEMSSPDRAVVLKGNVDKNAIMLFMPMLI